MVVGVGPDSTGAERHRGAGTEDSLVAPEDTRDSTRRGTTVVERRRSVEPGRGQDVASTTPLEEASSVEGGIDVLMGIPRRLEMSGGLMPSGAEVTAPATLQRSRRVAKASSKRRAAERDAAEEQEAREPVDGAETVEIRDSGRRKKKTKVKGVAVRREPGAGPEEATGTATVEEQAVVEEDPEVVGDCRTLEELMAKRVGIDPWHDRNLRYALLSGGVDGEWDAEERERVRKRMRQVKCEEGKFYANPKGLESRAWIPCPEERLSLIFEQHEAAAHEAASGLTERLRKDGIWWPNMRQWVTMVTDRCDVCQRANPAWRTVHDPARVVATQMPHERWAIDLLSLPKTLLGNVGVCVIVDALTKFPYAAPIKDKSSKEVARVLCDAVALLGPPRKLQSDNGSEFVAPLIEILCERTRIARGTITPGNPQSNGLVERVNKMIVEALRRMGGGNPDNWEWDLPLVLHALRSRRCSVTGYSPFRLLYGRDVSMFGEWRTEEPPLTSIVKEVAAQAQRLEELWTVTLPKARRNLAAAQLRQTRAQNARWQIGGPLRDGQRVFVKELAPASKLGNRFSGPYTIVRRAENGNYELQTAHGVLLRRSFPRHMLKAAGTQDELPGQEPDDAVPFEDVLSSRRVDGKWEYLVRWSDREEGDEKRDEWVPEENFLSAEAMLRYRRMAAVEVQVLDPLPATVQGGELWLTPTVEVEAGDEGQAESEDEHDADQRGEE